MDFCTSQCAGTKQQNQIQHVKNIQLEMKNVIKMPVNNDNNMLESVKLLDKNNKQTYGVIDKD